MKNTLCEQCYFAKQANDDKPCFFDIPTIINQDNHNITISQNGYNIIENYKCRYGFSKKIYNENIDKFANIDLVEYIKQNNIVKYSLVIVFDDKNTDHQNLLNKINQLSIKPSYITIIAYNKAESLHNLLKNGLDPFIQYKVHGFLEDMAWPKCLHIALETNKNKVGDLLWILTPKLLDSCIENDSIQNINYLINVEQTPAHYYMHKNSPDNHAGIFINTLNYLVLSKTLDYSLDKNSNPMSIVYD